MADESDSGSVQSTLSDQSTDKKGADLKRYYALYTFYPNRPQSVSDTTQGDNTEQTEDGNLSLSIAATNLSASSETDLRKSLAQRLSRNPSSGGHGNFLSIGISNSVDDVTSSSAACYYCILNKVSSSIESESTENTSPRARKFVVCFISFFDSSLDLFRQDLDNYCEGLKQLLDDELSQLNLGVKTYLEGWHETVLEYLTRCISRIGTENLQHLIYAALVDATLQITGASSQEEEDIKRFVGCCTLSPLLEQLQTSDQEQAGIVGSAADSWQVQPAIVPLALDQPDAAFNLQGLEQCHFCKMAGDHLATIDCKNVTKIRDSLESIKLAFVHNLNKLKRYLRQAELDHYALYMAFVFLKKCGCGNLLLRYVKLDASAETLKVLTSLEKFIADKGIQLT